MFNLDSLSLKYLYNENFDFINGAIIQKIQLPSRYEIILTLRNLNNQKAQNKKLYININPKYPHIALSSDLNLKKRNIIIPQKPPMFCMQLRKYLNGSKIKDFKIVENERILELYFDYFDEIGSLTKLCLAIELMGKHSNIILYNSLNKIIIGSIHNISQDKSSIREIYGGIKYIYPPIKEKTNLLNTSYSHFFEIAKDNAKDNNIVKISENFYYFNQAMLSKIFEKFNSLEEIFSFMQKLQNLEEKDFIISFWQNSTDNVNDAIDGYFAEIINKEILAKTKSKLKNYLKNEIKKNEKITKNQPDENKFKKNKTFGDLIMTYSYNIDLNKEKVILEDNEIELDKNLDIMQNAQKYYAKYKKEKSTFEHSKKRYEEAKEKLDYFETIIFNIENSNTFEELSEIENEIIDLGLIKNKKKENVELKITKLEFNGFDIYLGKNNKQNDYIISKIAASEDLWFHGLNFPSSHVILKVPNNKQKPPAIVLEFCAKLVKENSKAKNSGKTPIIMTKRKNLKKPPETYPGYVTYKNETEIII